MIRRLFVGVLLSAALSVSATGPASAAEKQNAEIIYQRHDVETAARLIRPLAERGDAIAQNRLGLLLEFGQGVPENHAEALAWYRKAADQGLTDAQYNLGRVYRSSERIPRDYAAAATWLRKAAEQGVSIAQDELGSMYFEGQGVPKDHAEALRWRLLAAEQGEETAQRALGQMYARGEGAPRDNMEAYKWYALCATGIGYLEAETTEACTAERDQLAAAMSEAQRAAAQRKVDEWRPKIWAEILLEESGGLSTQTDEQVELDSGNIVAAVQEALRQFGHDPGSIDGVAGQRTRHAAKSFERDHGLPEAGRITPSLIREMSRVFYEQKAKLERGDTPG